MFQDAVRSRPLVLLLAGFFLLYLWANWHDPAGAGHIGAGAGGRKDVVADDGVYFNRAKGSEDGHAHGHAHSGSGTGKTHAHGSDGEGEGESEAHDDHPRVTQPIKHTTQSQGQGKGKAGKLRKPNAASAGAEESGKAKRRPPPPPPPAAKPKPQPQPATEAPATKPQDAVAAPVTAPAVKAVKAVKKMKDKSLLPKLGPFDPTCPTTLVKEEDMPPEKPLPPGFVDKYVDNPNNVVMGLANSYPWNYVRRFVCSLRASGYIGKIVLLGAHWGGDTLAHFAAADVIGETYDGGRAHSDLLTYRFELFRQFALKYDTGDNLFLVTDIRDCYFQRNPFERIDLKGYELHLFEEAGYLTHRNETINRDWMGQCFGTAEDMLDKRIVNGGAMFGTAKGIAMGSELVYKEAMAGRGCNGRDQVYLNKLYHTGRMPYAIAHPQGDPGAPMNVIGYIPRTDGAPFAHPNVVGNLHPGLLVDEEGFVLDHDRRTRSACLHQYDRFIVIDQLIMRRQPHMYTKQACTWRNGKKIADGIIDW